MTVFTVPAPQPAVTDPLHVGFVFGDPDPMMLMPMPAGMTIPVCQVQEPEGISIVSPSTALCVGPLITAFTSDCLHEAASTVVPVLCARTAGPQMTSSAQIIARRLIRLNTDTGSFVRARILTFIYRAQPLGSIQNCDARLVTPACRATNELRPPPSGTQLVQGTVSGPMPTLYA